MSQFTKKLNEFGFNVLLLLFGRLIREFPISRAFSEYNNDQLCCGFLLRGSRWRDVNELENAVL